jgi:tRNA threonylcarbamoyladenosine biosynthesis protein TsaE
VSTERTRSARETEALGARLASSLAPGDVVLVAGELGSGKTTLIRGACRALGVEEMVQSPTFTIGRRYRGRVPISHLDLFRLDAPEREVPGLLDDYVSPDAVCFVEWPEAAQTLLPLPPEAAGRLRRVVIGHAGGDDREIRLG